MEEKQVRKLEDDEFIRQCAIYEQILVKRMTSQLGTLSYNLRVEATAYLVDAIKTIVMADFYETTAVPMIELAMSVYAHAKEIVLIIGHKNGG